MSTLISNSPDAERLFVAGALMKGLLRIESVREALLFVKANPQASVLETLIQFGYTSNHDVREFEQVMTERFAQVDDKLRALRQVANRTVERMLDRVEDPVVRNYLLDTRDDSTADISDIQTQQADGAVGGPFLYRTKDLRAQGGLGRIWFAHDLILDRPVAVKGLRPDLPLNADLRQRFLREAKITGRLQHPNIVPVYNYWTDANNNSFYSMRFINGDTFEVAIEKFHSEMPKAGYDNLKLIEMLEDFVAVCNTIAFAHKQGVIHRDLKPANIMVGTFGEVLVLDWGLAKVLPKSKVNIHGSLATRSQMLGRAQSDNQDPAFDSSTLPLPAETTPVAGPEWDFSGTDGPESTAHGRVLGSPLYMAPEQASGETDAINERTDVFGLGSILYKLLTNRPPHAIGPQNSRDSNLREVSKAKIPSASMVASWVPEPLAAICQKALAKSQIDRYPSAMELGLEVRRWISGESVLAYEEPWRLRARRWLMRHRVGTQVACSLILLLAVAVGSFSTYSWANERSISNLAETDALREADAHVDWLRMRIERFKRDTAMAATFPELHRWLHKSAEKSDLPKEPGVNEEKLKTSTTIDSDLADVMSGHMGRLLQSILLADSSYEMVGIVSEKDLRQLVLGAERSSKQLDVAPEMTNDKFLLPNVRMYNNAPLPYPPLTELFTQSEELKVGEVNVAVLSFDRHNEQRMQGEALTLGSCTPLVDEQGNRYGWLFMIAVFRRIHPYGANHPESLPMLFVTNSRGELVSSHIRDSLSAPPMHRENITKLFPELKTIFDDPSSFASGSRVEMNWDDARLIVCLRVAVDSTPPDEHLTLVAVWPMASFAQRLAYFHRYVLVANGILIALAFAGIWLLMRLLFGSKK